jgi:hypothetical protein
VPTAVLLLLLGVVISNSMADLLMVQPWLRTVWRSARWKGL